MSTLKEKSEAILAEKNNKIIPENIKNGVTIFDVEGTYTGGGSSTSDVKLFSSIEEMNNDETAEINDLAVVYGSNRVELKPDITMPIQKIYPMMDISISSIMESGTSYLLVAQNNSGDEYIILSVEPTNASLTYKVEGNEEVILNYNSPEQDGSHYMCMGWIEPDTAIEFNSTLYITDFENDIRLFKFFDIELDTYIGMYQYQNTISEDIVNVAKVDKLVFDNNDKKLTISDNYKYPIYQFRETMESLENYLNMEIQSGLEIKEVLLFSNSSNQLKAVYNYLQSSTSSGSTVSPSLYFDENGVCEYLVSTSQYKMKVVIAYVNQSGTYETSSYSPTDNVTVDNTTYYRFNKLNGNTDYVKNNYYIGMGYMIDNKLILNPIKHRIVSKIDDTTFDVNKNNLCAYIDNYYKEV